MKLITELSNCYLLHNHPADSHSKGLTYTVASKDHKKLWIVEGVLVLGPACRFLINGKGEGFSSPIEAAEHINKQIQSGDD